MSLLDVNVEVYAVLNEARNKLMTIYNFEEDIPEAKKKKLEKAIKSLDEALKYFCK